MTDLAERELLASIIGDRYFARRGKLFDGFLANADNDPVIKGLRHLQLSPREILEIGCGNGWRLQAIRERFESRCWGIDPSKEAIEDGISKFKTINLWYGTADDLGGYNSGSCDVVVFGYCLYNCNRLDLFKIASEADRVLANDGHVIVYDFMPEIPYSNPNPDCMEYFSYKMDYSKMFSWHPFYRIVYRNLWVNPEDSLEKLAVIALKKSEF